MIKFDTSHAHLQENIFDYQKAVTLAHTQLHEKSGAGNDFVGWVEWPNSYDHEEFERIKAAAKRLEGQCDVLLVCGIGGSYLGARAAIEMMRGLYCQNKPEVIFIGNTFSSTYFKQVEGNRFERDFQIRNNNGNRDGVSNAEAADGKEIFQGRMPAADFGDDRQGARNVEGAGG